MWLKLLLPLLLFLQLFKFLLLIFDAFTTSDPNIKRTREMFVETCSTIICIFYSCEYIIINLLRISCFHICISLYYIILPWHFISLHVYHKFKPTSYNVITFGLSSHSPSEHLRASSLLIFCIIHLVTWLSLLNCQGIINNISTQVMKYTRSPPTVVVQCGPVPIFLSILIVLFLLFLKNNEVVIFRKIESCPCLWIGTGGFPWL